MGYIKDYTWLPVRPAPRQDEWLETYLGRLARANGVQRPWSNDLERIRHQAGRTREAANGPPPYNEQNLPSWAVLGRRAQIRYCPACLQESRYVRARWRLTALEACTIHNLTLKAGLVEPAITAMYNKPGKRQVDQITDEEIWANAMCPMPIERSYVHSIWARFESAVTGHGGLDPTESLAWALLAERMLDLVVTAVRGPDYPPKNVSRIEHRAHWLANAGLKLEASEKGVLDFLLSLELNAHRRAAASCLISLIEDEVRRKTVMSCLPLQYLHDRLVAVAPEMMNPSSCGALPRVLHPPGYVSLDYTEALLGCNPTLLFFFVREGFFRQVQKLRFGHKQYVFIHRLEVETCRRWLASCMTCEQVFEALQIDRQGYWALLDSQLLKPIKLGCWRRHRRQDIYGLTRQLDSLSLPYPVDRSNLLPLMGAWLCERNRPREAVTQLLNEIWRGELPLYRKLDGPGLQAYFVDATAVLRLQRLAEMYRAKKLREIRCDGQYSLLEAIA